MDALLSAQEPAAPVPEKEEAPQAKSAVIEESKEEVAEPSQPEPAQADPAQPEAAQQTPPSVFNQDWLNQLNKQMEQLQQQMQEMEKVLDSFGDSLAQKIANAMKNPYGR